MPGNADFGGYDSHGLWKGNNNALQFHVDSGKHRIPGAAD